MKLVLLGLATWRLSSLLVNEDGPLNVFARLRDAAGVNREGELSQLATLLSCVWCTSIWVAAALYALARWPFVLYTLAASALAVVLAEADNRIPRG